MKRALKAHKHDNVATLVSEGYKDDIAVLQEESRDIEVQLKESVPMYHKFSLVDLSEGDEIIKYGEIIGMATRNVRKGEHVHIHNVESRRGRGDKSEGRE